MVVGTGLGGRVPALVLIRYSVSYAISILHNSIDF